jgi:hypothetical protein
MMQKNHDFGYKCVTNSIFVVFVGVTECRNNKIIIGFGFAAYSEFFRPLSMLFAFAVVFGQCYSPLRPIQTGRDLATRREFSVSIFILKTENSRRVAESRLVCVGLYAS